jgi:hypothetical protein
MGISSWNVTTLRRFSVSIVSGSIQGIAALRSGRAAAKASQQAAAMQYLMYQQQRKDTAPWRESGKKALNELSAMIGRGPGEFTKSPGYEFRLGEGRRNIEAGAAAGGGLLSGREQKALVKYGQDYATNDYDNFLARYYNSLTPYQSMAGLGLTGTGMITSAGTQAAQAGGNYLSNAGYYKGAGIANAGNAFGSAMSGAGNAIGSALGNYFGSRGGGGGGGIVGSNYVVNDANMNGNTYTGEMIPAIY